MNRLYTILFKGLFVFLFAIGMNILQAQTIRLNGTIKDKLTKEALIGASIVEKGTTKGMITDINGKFSLSIDVTKPATMVVSYLGYKPKEVVINSTSNTYIDIYLQENIVEAKEVVVTASRVSQKVQESPITVERMNTIAIKETPAVGFYEGLSNLKGVDMTSASLGFKIINTRGFNSTSPVRTLQIIDGMDNQAPGLNFSLGNFVGASEIDVESVDLVVGANSATFGPNAFNGVINITTKDPFKYPGLNVQVKAANRNLFDGAIRYAHVSQKMDEKKYDDGYYRFFAKLNNKYLLNRFAYKVNASYLRADDWVADNYAPAYRFLTQPNNSENSIYGHDAVNIYGDENPGSPRTRGDLFTDLPDNDTSKYYVFRTGYKEKDLTDYKTVSLKLSGGMYYKIYKDVTLSYFYNRGTGSTVYQGDNRYAIKDILFQQHRAEIKGERFFARAYTTLEDAGNSYDLVFTAYKLLQKTTSNGDWRNRFQNAYRYYASQPQYSHNQRVQLSRDSADSKMLRPGTPEFDAAFQDITSKASYLPTKQGDVGGTRFQDHSSLTNYEAQYDFNLSKIHKNLPSTFKLGANYRTYNPQSFGTIFSDTLNNKQDINSGFTRINVFEYGVYGATEKKFFDDKLKFIAAARMDFHKNFAPHLSPAVSLLYSYNPSNTFRLTYTTAVRNPTLQDQYLFYNIGRAILSGNLHGFGNDRYMLLTEYITALADQDTAKKKYVYNVDAIRPERVQTIEVGYKGIVFKKLYVDVSYYYSSYKDFIGNVLLINNPKTTTTDSVFRVAANAKDIVTSQGFGIGLNYYFEKYFAITGNYTYAILDKKGSTDPLIPSFNTPKHKFNIGFSGRNLFNKYGFNINYKFVDTFEYTGSPQFTGIIPAYGLLDAQVNYKLASYNSTFKLGMTNIINNRHYEAYGAPYVGSLAYFSINYEF